MIAVNHSYVKDNQQHSSDKASLCKGWKSNTSDKHCSSSSTAYILVTISTGQYSNNFKDLQSLLCAKNEFKLKLINLSIDHIY